MKAVSIRLVIVSLLLTSVFSITMKRRVMSTTFPERSSTTVIKMLYQVSEYSRKASKSGTETYVKIICLCDETRHRRSQIPFIAQWLELLTADQHVLGSIPTGGHGLPS